MDFHYKEVVPWGRSFDEYVAMFHLSASDLNLKIIGCGDGPASFNAEMCKRGKRIVSVDPIYQFNTEDIKVRIDETYHDVISQTYKNKDKFIWEKIPSVEVLGKVRMEAMKIFLADFEQGKKEKRYIDAELPVLPFKNDEFDLALSSHFLFLYTDNLSLDFHIDAIKEMLRIAKEIRIFPLLDVNGRRSIYVDNIKKLFNDSGKKVIVKKVDYEFQKGGNKMLVIRD